MSYLDFQFRKKLYLKMGILALSILTVTGSVFAFANESLENNQSIEGEINLPAPSANNENIRLNFLYGDLPNPQTLPESTLDQHAKNIDVIQTGTTSEQPIVVLEDEGSEVILPERLTRGKKIVHIMVPASVRTFWNSVYVKPSAGDITSGVVFASLRGVTTSIIWYSNVEPMFATSMTAWMIAVTYTLSTYHITIDNALLYNIKDRETKIGKMWSRFVLGFRTLALDLSIGNAANLAGGMQKSLLQATVDNLGLTLVNNAYNSQKNVMLKDRRELKLTYNFVTRPFLYVLRGLQDINKWPALFSIGAYPVTHSLLASFGLYAGLFVLNVAAGDKVIATLETIHTRVSAGIKSLGIWMNGTSTTPCKQILDGKTGSDGTFGFNFLELQIKLS